MKKQNFHLKDPLKAFRELFSKRPVCAAVIAVCSAFAAVYFTLESALSFQARNTSAYGLFEDMLIVLFLFAAGVFFTENAFPKQKGLKKAVLMLPAALVAFVLGTTAWEGPLQSVIPLSERFGKVLDDRYTAFTVGYLVVTLALALWFCFRNLGGKDFPAYALRVFDSILRDGCVLMVVLVGVGLINVIVMMLLWEHVSNVTLPLVCLITGLWFCPNAALAFLNADEEPHRFTTMLVRCVLLALCAAAYAVICVYILKILITWTFPKNTVFGILTALFAVSMPVALMSEDEAKNDLSHRAAVRMPALFLPFALMQALCLGLRIAQYGLTTSRYLGIALILFECTVSIWHMFSRRSVAGVLPVLAAMAVLCAFTPKIDCMSLPDALQAETLRAGLEADPDTLSETKVSRLYAAATYRGLTGSNEVWLRQYFSEEEREKIGALKERLAVRDSGRIRLSNIWAEFSPAYPLALRGFERLYEVGFECRREESPIDLSAVSLQAYNTSRADESGSVLPEATSTIDISSTVEKLFAAELAEPGVPHELDPELILPDGSVLHFTSLWIELDEASGETCGVYGQGLLLTK